ncbi:MAG: T9SS type A sorting domain-containing protein [Bacteroidetes bacterium]|nr:T9SS type A sorting domain-containing protein [Bacteroidota bacterium]
MKKYLLLPVALFMANVFVSGQTLNPVSAGNAAYSPLLPTLCGSYNVGAGQIYVTLTAAIADLNSRGVSCPVTFVLMDNTYPSETFPITIGTVAGVSFTNTVTIKPGAGKTPVISGSSATAILIINGSKYVIIDGSNSGGSDKSLSWANTSTATNTYTIELMNPGALPASNILIKNCQIKASSQITKNTYGIFLDNTNGAYDSITISNNTISSARFGIQFQGIAGAVATNGQILNNIIGSVTDAEAIQFRGIFLRQADNTLIQGNEIMGAPLGNANTAQAGIWMPGGVTNTRILQNKIHDWYYPGTGGYGNYGIYYGAAAGTPTEISNNTITTIKSDGAIGNQDNITAGIYINSGGNIRIYHNSIWLTGAVLRSANSGASACLSIFSGINGLNVRDNIFKNSQTLIGGSNGTTFAVYCASANTVFGSINYNDYYDDGVNPNIGYLGSNQATLANWQAATGMDANSLNIDPVFTGSNDLHTSVAGLAKTGVYIALVPVDITGAGRTNPPDMGAYEFSANQIVTTSAATAILGTSATLNGTINASNATVTSGYDYGLTTNYGTSIAGVPPTVTGTTVTGFTGAAAGLTGNTLYHFRAKGVSGGVTVYGSDLTFITLSSPPTVVTTAATGVTATLATLNGTVNANGSSSTVFFDYGLTTTYGNTAAGTPSPVTGNSVTSVSCIITALMPCTLYHYRVYATNTGGTAYGNDLTFTTAAAAPYATTTPATAIGPTVATLNGTITANCASTTVTFDYGLTTTYGTTVPGVPSPVTGNAATLVNSNIIGLSIGATYHFRVCGTNANGSTCGNDMTFTTGCPVAGPAGPITGPTQVCQGGSGYVYTVTIPNATGYVWTLPIGGTITAGAGTNTITVSYAYNAAPGYMFVYGTAPCGNGAPSMLAVSVNSPATPTITGPASVCVNSAGNVYTTQTGMSNYTWTVSAGGAVTAGGGTNAITVTWSTTGAKTVTVNYKTAAGCWAISPTVYNVTVNPLPAPTIIGPNPACSNYPGLIYSTQAGMTGYTWTISAGGSITAGTGTNAITVTWNNTGAQSVSVNYTNANGCTAAAAVTYPVTVNSGATPTIIGPNSLCVNSGYCTYTTQAGMTAYNWTISPGGIINFGSGTNAVTVSWIGSGAQWISVNYTNPSGCSAPAPTQFNVTVNPLPGSAGSITGTAAVCGGANGVAYSTPVITGAVTYIWTLPAGAAMASGAGTNTITVNYAANASNGNITVYGNNMCGNGTTSAPFAVTVTALPAAAGTISGPASVCEGETGVLYSVPPVTGATGYTWTLPIGVTMVSAVANTITVDFTAAAVSGIIRVFGTNACGSGAASPDFNVTVNPIPPTPVVTNIGYMLYSSAPLGNQWYYSATWSGTGVPIPGATAQTYDASLTGQGVYWTIVTLNGCSSDTSNHWILVVGIDNHTSSSIKIYPVPNDGKFTVTFSGTSSETYTISVFNNIGVKIWEEKNVELNSSTSKVIDLRPVPNGVYTVIFENSLNQVVKKIVVNK